MSQNPGSGYGQTPPGQPYGYPPQQGQPGIAPYGQPATPQYGQPATQPYGQPATPQYGQPATPQYGQPATQPYGQQAPQQAQPTSYPGQQPYGQPVQGYEAAQPGAYGTAPVTPAKRSPILGIVALAIVVICGIVLSAAMWRLGGLVGGLVAQGTVDPNNQTELQSAILNELGGVWTLLVNGSGILGFAGWIMGIVAVATKRGRAFGVITIILGVLAPIAAFVAMFAALAPYLS